MPTKTITKEEIAPISMLSEHQMEVIKAIFHSTSIDSIDQILEVSNEVLAHEVLVEKVSE